MSGGRRPRGKAAGYTLVEMMIAVAMAVIVGAGIYAVYNSQRRVSLSQKVSLELQTSCAFVMDQMKQELLLAGYRADETRDLDPGNTADRIFSAVHHKTGDGTNKLFDEIDFEYFDVQAKFRDVATTDPAYDPNVAFDQGSYSEHTKIRFVHTDGVKTLPGEAAARPAGQIVRVNWRWHKGTSQYLQEARPPQLLAENVQNLGFQLFGEDNRQLFDGSFNPVSPANAPNYDRIREVRIGLTCQAPKADPLTGRTPSITLTAAVKPRNIGLESNPKDTAPPAVPQHLAAWDPGGCGALAVRWDANADADLAGYTLFSGLAAGAYTNRVRLARGPKSAGYEYYTLTGVAPTKATDATPATYHLVVTAFDKSGNQSTYSAEVSGNPGTVADPDDDTRNEGQLGAKGSDTTLNPYPPPAPGGFAAAPPAGWDADPPDAAKFNRLELSWSPAAVDGLRGYRLYRGESADFAPTGVTEGSGNCIADEHRLGPGAVSHADAGLLACRPYFYKLAAIHCDPTLPIAQMNFAAAAGTPRDRIPPSAPRLAARPGYERVILSLENPVTEGAGAEPDFTRTRIWYAMSTAPGSHHPAIDAAGNVTGGAPLPNSLPYDPAQPGVFSLPGTQPTINFYSTATGDPATVDPSLPIKDPPETGEYLTYYFLAVSYDTCGNHSPNVAQAQATQCGDCEPSEPCYGPPPPPAGIDAEGCDESLVLSWEPIDTDLYHDLAGFRITRREGTTWASGTADYELSGGDPLWFTSIKDQGVEPGKVYSYRISSTDCYYELSGNVANRIDRTIEGLAVGRVRRETGEPVLTGDLLAPDPTFQHNTVTLRLQNTADGRFFLRELTALWENPAAYLRRLLVGDANTTPVTTAFEETAPPLTRGGGGSSQVLTLATTLIEALDERIPMVTTFQSQGGTVSRDVNLRQDRIDLGLLSTNATTGTTGCAVSDSVFIPLGPVVSGVTMDRPTAGTPAWAVPGDSGENTIVALPPVIVPGEAPVAVAADVLDSSFAVGIHKVWLYYFVDTARLYTLGPPPLSGTYDDLTGGFNYQAIPMVPVAGNQWRTPVGQGIPANNNTNVWFFILAVDNDGNFDREPEAESGAFVYYQQLDPAVCSTVPNPPALGGSSTSSQVILTLAAPALNTDGSLFSDRKGFEIWRAVGSGAFTRIAVIATNAAIYTYTDTPPEIGAAGKDFSYYATAVDTCSPANVSAASAIFTECEGADPCTISLSPAGAIHPGGAFTIDLGVCARQNGAFDELLYVQDCAAGGADYHPIELREVDDTGRFRINAGAYGGRGEVKTSLTSGTTSLDLRVLENDTVTVRGYAAVPGGSWGSACDPSLACAASLTVTPDPCLSPVAPGAPQNLTVAGSSCTANGATVSLTWSAPAAGPVSHYRVYRCNGTDCEPAALLADAVTATSYTDANPGGKLNSDSIQLWYTVKTVNAACPSDLKEGAGAAKESDGCGAN